LSVRAVTALWFRFVRELFPDFVNDPRASDWELRVQASGTVLLSPKSVEDARFAYRGAAVPASSHPTIAAALAWVAQPTSADVIWDPFVGAGTELRECFERTPSKAYLGTDASPEALQKARTQKPLRHTSIRPLEAPKTPPPHEHSAVGSC
jgi:hypothetical protein